MPEDAGTNVGLADDAPDRVTDGPPVWVQVYDGVPPAYEPVASSVTVVLTRTDWSAPADATTAAPAVAVTYCRDGQP